MTSQIPDDDPELDDESPDTYTCDECGDEFPDEEMNYTEAGDFCDDCFRLRLETE